jgi:nucleotide-binding universal stress UspA family protein
MEPDDAAIRPRSAGRPGLSRLILGSVADKVVRGTPLPILLHRCREA